jgi:hypothetical protein
MEKQGEEDPRGEEIENINLFTRAKLKDFRVEMCHLQNACRSTSPCEEIF